MIKIYRSFLALSLVTLAACLTINIYFPAEELRGAADKIVDEVWGDQDSQPRAPSTDNPGSFINRLIGPSTAHAAQDIDVSTPEIRAVKDRMIQRRDQLTPYLNAGQVGIGRDGLLKVRGTDGLDLRSRGEVNRLVNEENTDRQRLYREIAIANGFPDRVDEVREIFADSWRNNARAGWYLEQPDGTWQIK